LNKHKTGGKVNQLTDSSEKMKYFLAIFKSAATAAYNGTTVSFVNAKHTR
jgi:hypothetical protein